MAVCKGKDHKIISWQSPRKTSQSVCILRDLRQPADAATQFHVSGGEECHGILMSLAMRDSTQSFVVWKMALYLSMTCEMLKTCKIYQNLIKEPWLYSSVISIHYKPCYDLALVLALWEVVSQGWMWLAFDPTVRFLLSVVGTSECVSWTEAKPHRQLFSIGTPRVHRP